jgi:prepilin-type N-terminal cleavage/methylation domain-containing protein/prepilin-type processing-associated H-X9-DG protein
MDTIPDAGQKPATADATTDTAVGAAASAFTLVELLTVIAIIGILAAIIIPTVGRIRRSAADAACMSNIRQLTTAYLMFLNDYNMKPMPGYIGPNNPNQWESLAEGHDSGAFVLLRYHYKPGPRYIWTTNGRWIVEKVEHCPAGPMTNLTRTHLPVGINYSNLDYGVRENGGGQTSYAHHGAPSRTPLLWDALSSNWNQWGNAWQKVVPLRHSGGKAINCGFLDGHAERILQDDSDGRLSLSWWVHATNNPEPDNSKLRIGDKIGVTQLPPQ